MAAGVKGDISLGIHITHNGATGLGTPKMSIDIDELLSVSQGTAAINQADTLWVSKARSLSASASENLDLAGVLTDAFGTTVADAEIVALYVKAAAANTNNVIVGNAASNAFVGPMGATGTFTVKPGEWAAFVSASGWAVTSATGDILKVANGGAGTAVVYDIVIVGRTVAA